MLKFLLTIMYNLYIIFVSDKLNSTRGEQNPYNSTRGVRFFLFISNIKTIFIETEF